MDIQKKINNKIDNLINITLYKTEKINVMIKNTVGIVCKKCKSDNVNVYVKQTRSSDEASSKFYTCLNCGNKWKVD